MPFVLKMPKRPCDLPIQELEFEITKAKPSPFIDLLLSTSDALGEEFVIHGLFTEGESTGVKGRRCSCFRILHSDGCGVVGHTLHVLLRVCDVDDGYSLIVLEEVAFFQAHNVARLQRTAW